MNKIDDLVYTIAKAQAIVLKLSKVKGDDLKYAYTAAHLRYAMGALHAVIQNKLEEKRQRITK